MNNRVLLRVAAERLGIQINKIHKALRGRGVNPVRHRGQWFVRVDDLPTNWRERLRRVTSNEETQTA